MVRGPLGRKNDIAKTKPAWGTFENNWLTPTDPGFVDMAAGDFTLKPDSEAFKKIKGFEAPPFARMGLYKDQWRSQLPAREGFALEPVKASQPGK